MLRIVKDHGSLTMERASFQAVHVSGFFLLPRGFLCGNAAENRKDSGNAGRFNEKSGDNGTLGIQIRKCGRCRGGAVATVPPLHSGFGPPRFRRFSGGGTLAVIFLGHH